jgi:hypothetical protein
MSSPSSLSLVPNKNHKLILKTSPILLPSSNETPAVKKCWDWLACQLPNTYSVFKQNCTNNRWKIQNLKADSSKGSKQFIFTKIALAGEERHPSNGSISYHVIYFYTLSRSALYKHMVPNDDPLNQDKVLLKPIKTRLMSNLPQSFFNQFQTIFNDECCLVFDKNGHVFVSVKRN